MRSEGEMERGKEELDGSREEKRRGNRKDGGKKGGGKEGEFVLKL